MENEKPVVKLPIRYFFTLEQAAKYLECDSDYLLHLAETRRLPLMARMKRSIYDISIVYESVWDGETKIPCPEFVALTSWDLMEWGDYNRNHKLYLFNSGYDIGLSGLEHTNHKNGHRFHNNGRFHVVNTRSGWQEPKQTVTTTSLIDKLIQEATGTEPEEQNLDSSTNYFADYIEIKLSDIYLSAGEVSRLRHGGIWPKSIVNEQKQQPKQPPEIESPVSKMIGLLAVLLAEKNGKYKRGDKPNASQIASEAYDLLTALPDATTYGLGDTKLRTAISEGVKALIETK